MLVSVKRRTIYLTNRHSINKYRRRRTLGYMFLSEFELFSQHQHQEVTHLLYRDILPYPRRYKPPLSLPLTGGGYWRKMELPLGWSLPHLVQRNILLMSNSDTTLGKIGAELRNSIRDVFICSKQSDAFVRDSLRVYMNLRMYDTFPFR